MVKLVNSGYKPCSSWGIVKHGVPQRPVLGQLLFLLYINDIMKITNTKDKNNKSKLVLFAEDTLIITSPNPTNFIRHQWGIYKYSPFKAYWLRDDRLLSELGGTRTTVN